MDYYIKQQCISNILIITGALVAALESAFEYRNYKKEYDEKFRKLHKKSAVAFAIFAAAFIGAAPFFNHHWSKLQKESEQMKEQSRMRTIKQIQMKQEIRKQHRKEALIIERTLRQHRQR